MDLIKIDAYNLFKILLKSYVIVFALKTINTCTDLLSTFEFEIALNIIIYIILYSLF